MGNWYATGDDGDRRMLAEASRQKKARKSGDKNWYGRWWMRASGGGQGRFATFVDDPSLAAQRGIPSPYVFMEHQVYRNGSWFNWYTCIDGLEDPNTGVKLVCPICAVKNPKNPSKKLYPPSLVAAYTVIDHREWTDKHGETKKDTMSLFLAKTSVYLKLKKAAASRGGSLRGYFVEISRQTDDDPNTGNDFDWLEKRDLDPEVVPPDYREVFAPLSTGELQDMLDGKDVSKNSSSSGGYSKNQNDSGGSNQKHDGGGEYRGPDDINDGIVEF